MLTIKLWVLNCMSPNWFCVAVGMMINVGLLICEYALQCVVVVYFPKHWRRVYE